MAAGLIAKKAGMTQVFSDDGDMVPVTVLSVEPCKVIARRTAAQDGYDAIQVGFGAAGKRTPRAVQGHYARQGQPLMGGLKEFRLRAEDAFEVGQELTADLFSVGQKVDITGIVKGRGFAGVMKRWNYAGGKASHGAEKVHRSGGSTGNRQFPGRVFPGKKMAGHYGACQMTKQNVVVVRVDAENSRILVRGAVPGPKGGTVVIRPAVKGA